MQSESNISSRTSRIWRELVVQSLVLTGAMHSEGREKKTKKEMDVINDNMRSLCLWRDQECGLCSEEPPKRATPDGKQYYCSLGVQQLLEIRGSENPLRASWEPPQACCLPSTGGHASWWERVSFFFFCKVVHSTLVCRHLVLCRAAEEQ